MDADVSSLPARLRFQTSAQNRFSGSLSMSSDRCESLRVGLMVRPRTTTGSEGWPASDPLPTPVLFVCAVQEPVRHLVEPLVFSLNFSLVQKPPRRTQGLQDLQRFPLLSRTPQPIRTQVRPTLRTSLDPNPRRHLNPAHLERRKVDAFHSSGPLPEGLRF